MFQPSFLNTSSGSTEQQSSSKQGLLSSSTITSEGFFHVHKDQSKQPYFQQHCNHQNLSHARPVSSTSLAPYSNTITPCNNATFHSISPQSHTSNAAVTMALVTQPSVTQPVSALDTLFHPGDDMMHFMSPEFALDLPQYSFGVPTSTSTISSWTGCREFNYENTSFTPFPIRGLANNIETFINNPATSSAQACQTDVQPSQESRVTTDKEQQLQRVCDRCYKKKIRCMGNRNNCNTCFVAKVKCENTRPVLNQDSKARKLVKRQRGSRVLSKGDEGREMRTKLKKLAPRNFIWLHSQF